MSIRAHRALQFGIRYGIGFAVLGAFHVLIRRPTASGLGWAGFLLLVPAASFVVLGGMVFALAYAFPPPGDELTVPNAGRVIWPLVGLLVLGTIALVIFKR